jgi:hypothetical protein
VGVVRGGAATTRGIDFVTEREAISHAGENPLGSNQLRRSEPDRCKMNGCRREVQRDRGVD